MDTNTPGDVGPFGVLDRRADPRDAVTGVYQAHAVGLIRLAVVMLGDRPVAEEVVQEAFCGLSLISGTTAVMRSAASRSDWKLFSPLSR